MHQDIFLVLKGGCTEEQIRSSDFTEARKSMVKLRCHPKVRGVQP